jgi:hypothetical protein
MVLGRGVHMETGSTNVVSVSQRGMRHFGAIALALVLFGGGVSASTFGPMLMREIGVMPAAAQDASTPVATDGVAAANACFVDSDGVQADLWARSELYFGTTKEDGTAYSNEEWLQFLADEVTPRFPDGLTVLTGLGQWRDSESSQVIQERSNVLIILHPLSNYAESSVKLEEIRDAYEQQFNQSSVLRTDDSVGVCTSF